jgi:Fe-S-cluster-containing dehydrogenase component
MELGPITHFFKKTPDPITKATWDNYIMISPLLAEAQKLTTGDVVEIRNENYAVEAPVLVQPGQDINSVSIAAGYGRRVAGKVAKGVGVNAYGFTSFADGATSYSRQTIAITKTTKRRELALTQTHHSMEGRDIVRETTYKEYKQNPKSGNEKKAKLVNIYPPHDYSKGHQWAMAIDLSKCTGCSSCITSCNLENNVPVVGRQEVYRRREMHWLRIDRYYAGDENQPEVVHQPMLCQHCENAPCENVCPVMAIAHSSDGLNQQVYNRCVGTRYCANNCPYKVRRFNWFTYAHDDKYENMALNPDISVRTRGVMEKCSMCIQRIQEGKLDKKKKGQKLKDGDIKTACQQSCPADAVVFGDMNDPKSKISMMLDHDRNYTVLEELNVRPRVSYLTKIRNK